MSKGEEIIGNFNPNDREDVAEIKKNAIELINSIERLGVNPRRKAAAITDVEKAAMMAVKSLF